MCEIIFGNLIAIVIHYEIIQHCVIFKLLLSCYSIKVSVGDTILASATFALRQKISNSESDITAKSWNCPAPVRKLRVLRSCVAKLLVIWRGLGVFYPCILVYIEAGWSSANDIWRNPVLSLLLEGGLPLISVQGCPFSHKQPTALEGCPSACRDGHS